MPKVKTSFRCQECGYAAARWLGRCPECEHWNTFVEEEEAPPMRPGASGRSRTITPFSSEIVRLEDLRVSPLVRAPTGVAEFDRVLGGGVVPGSLILLGGPPGIGKSTLMLQVMAGLCGRPSYAETLQTSSPRIVGGDPSLSYGNHRPPTTTSGATVESGHSGATNSNPDGLYISGEESLEQVKDRAHRLNLQVPGLSLVSETELSRMVEAIDKITPRFCVIDSIQTTYREDMSSAPGSVGQVR
jgi:DNA repair protein RadA/Sms